jgi:hypothetical protein
MQKRSFVKLVTDRFAYPILRRQGETSARELSALYINVNNSIVSFFRLSPTVYL